MEASTDSPQTIAVIGMGPVGQILAVHLREAGQRVILCDRDKARMHRIRKEGISLVGAMQKHAEFDEVLGSLAELLPFEPDVVFLAVKAYHMEDVLAEMEGFPREGIAYVSAQNGIDVELALADQFSESSTYRMVVNYAGNHRAPNVIGVSFFNPPNYIASIDDSHPEVATRLAEMLSGVRLDTVMVDSYEILRRVWEKTVLNSSLSALCGVAQMTMKEVMALPDMVHIIEQVIIESIAVANAENIHLESNFLRHCLRYLRRSGNHFPSLAVDLLHRRPTEIDYLNGKFVEYGKKHYVRTPMHLLFTNMVKAITIKHGAASSAPVVREPQPYEQPAFRSNGTEGYYLGVDLGSAYTKLVVVNEQQDLLYREIVRTLNRDRKPLYDALAHAHEHFPIAMTCAAGYGREHFPDADLTMTEIQCAARRAFQHIGGGCNIIDIGAEDIKAIEVDAQGKVAHFYMNSKCAAGTGAFLTEMADRVEIDIDDMSKLAALSSTTKELNSFCTVFSKTEVMKWMFDQLPVEDIARGIYLSLANRVVKLKLDPSLPIYLAGGVIAHHPYLRTLLEELFAAPVGVIREPQYCVAYGAALFAQRHARRAAQAQAQQQSPLEAALLAATMNHVSPTSRPLVP
jgi:2-dehydropantoate 2-reductase